MPSASSLFLLFSISENLLLEIFSELEETLRRIFIRQKEDLDQRGPGGGTQGPGTTPSHDSTCTRGQDPPLVLVGPLGPLDTYKLLIALKNERAVIIFHKLHPKPPPSDRKSVV